MISLKGALAYVQQAVGLDAPPVRIAELVEAYLTKEVGPAGATEQVEAYARRVAVVMAREYEDSITSRKDPWFSYNSSSPDYVQGLCYAEPRDPGPIRAAKANRLGVLPFKTALQGLSFSQFEDVCAAALSLLGAREFRVTERTRDQGIDFYGYVLVGDLEGSAIPFFKFTDNMKLWLVGQAKHYVGGKVQAPELRNLVGSLNLARHKEYSSSTSLTTGLHLRSGDPAFALFLTSGTYTRDAVSLAQSSGVVTKDIDDIAKLLADRAVGRAATGPEALAEWAAQIVGER